MATKLGKVIETNTFNMADIRVSGPSADSRKGITKSKDNKLHQMVNVEIPMFNGQVFDSPDGEKYGSNKGQLTIDLATVGPNQTEVNARNPELKKYVGSTEAKTPVDIEQFEDLRDAANPDKAKLIIDPVALARATYEIKSDYAKAHGLRAPSPTTKERLDITAGWSTTKNGVGAMSKEGMEANVAQVAAQNYVFTASKDRPNAGKPSKADIESVALIINEAYKTVAEGIERGDYADGMKSARNGQKIDGTTLAQGALSAAGFKVREVDGATVIAAEGEVKAQDARNTLNAFSKIVNATVSQKINTPGFDGNDTVKKLANLVKVNSYPVNPYADGKKVNDLTVVQPSVNVTFQPYAQSVIKSTELMRRTPDQVSNQVQTAAEKYSDEIIKNAQEIHDYVPKSNLTREQALENQKNFVEEIRAAMAIEPPTPPTPPAPPSSSEPAVSEDAKSEDVKSENTVTDVKPENTVVDDKSTGTTGNNKSRTNAQKLKDEAKKGNQNDKDATDPNKDRDGGDDDFNK